MDKITETKPSITELEQQLRAEVLAAVKTIMKAGDDKKAVDIVAVRVADKTIVADWFVFMSGTSAIHTKSVCDEIEDNAKQTGLNLLRREGYNEGRWIVLDYANILVHIFHPEEREYYNVERLWMDETTETLRIEDMAD